MEQHDSPLWADVQPLLDRAAREVTRYRRPDALLALVLRWETVIPPAGHAQLHRCVAARARAFDARLLEVLIDGPRTIYAAARNRHLGPANAEWLAVRCIASILPAASMAEWDVSRDYRAALLALVVEQRLSAHGLAARVLFREACIANREFCHLARQALSFYLLFPDVPPLRLERLAKLWRDDEWGMEQLQRYEPRGTVTG